MCVCACVRGGGGGDGIRGQIMFMFGCVIGEVSISTFQISLPGAGTMKHIVRV